MDRIIQAPPNPHRQAFLDYIGRLQHQRFLREQQRAQEREAQEQRTITGVGIGLGALGGALFAPAAVASASGAVPGIAAGTALTAAGAPAVPAMLSSILTGASIGGQIGQQFGIGDIAGGVTTAASAARGIMQAQEDQELYGYSVSPKERMGHLQAGLKLGLTPAQLARAARETGTTIPKVLYSAQVEAADAQRTQEMLVDAGIMMSEAEFTARAEDYPGGPMSLFLDLQSQVGEMEAAFAGRKAYETVMGTKRGEAHAAAVREGMEVGYDPRAIANQVATLNALDQAQRDGDLTLEQATQQAADLPPLQLVERPRRTPRTVEEEEVQSGATGHYYIRTKDGDFRPVGNMKEEGLAEAILKHQQELIRGTMGTPITVQQAAADYVDAHRVADQIKAGTFRVAAPRPVPRPTGAPAPTAQPRPPQSTVDPQLQARLQRASGVLAWAMKQFPDVDNWTAQMREDFYPAAKLLNEAFVQKLERGERVTPEEEQLARFAAQIIRRGMGNAAND